MNDVNKTLVTEARLADHLKLTGGRIRYDCFDVEEGEEVYLVFVEGECTHSGCLRAALYQPDNAVKVSDKRA